MNKSRPALQRLLTSFGIFLVGALVAAEQNPSITNRSGSLKAVCQQLGIGTGAVIADVSCGDGSDSMVFASIVGERGTVMAQEIETAKLKKVIETADKLEPPDVLPPAPEGQVWRLCWHDEFDGEKLDESKWEAPEHPVRDAWWTRKAVGLDGKGHLVIRTFHEGGRYYDGGVRTRGKFEHTFGLYIARMKLQRHGGHWSAFWLWNRGMKYAGPDEGPLRFEVDIMERPWLDDRVQHTLHWGPLGKYAKSAGEVARVAGLGEGWHTFAVLWKPEEYVFFVDGKETWRPRGVTVCQSPLYLLLTDEIEFKGWAGDIRQATLPDEFLTDYVRVYDLVDAQTGKLVWVPKPPKGQ